MKEKKITVKYIFPIKTQTPWIFSKYKFLTQPKIFYQKVYIMYSKILKNSINQLYLPLTLVYPSLNSQNHNCISQKS